MENSAQQARKDSLLTRLNDFDRHNKEFERFWKFSVVGTIGAIIDFGTFTLLNATGWLDIGGSHYGARVIDC